MNKKRCFYFSLMVIWMMVIYMFSSQQGTTSASLSSSVTEFILSLIYLPYKSLNIESQIELLEKFHLLIRKLAHMSEYAFLWFLSYQWLKTYSLSKRINFILALAICFSYACTDEFHQSFIPGRGPSLIDVFIDTSGGFLFGSGYLFLENIYHKKKVKFFE